MTVQNLTGPLDWDDLRVFVELARRRSLSGAARALGVTHATIGRRLASLEAALGCVLAERRADGYVLTADGETVLELAATMDEAAAAIRRRGHRGGDLTGTVRLAATETFGARFLVPRLAPLQARHPALTLEVVTDNRNVSLARREADMAVRWARPQEGELVARRLGVQAYGLYAAASYLERRPAAGDVYLGFDETVAELPEARWMARLTAGGRVGLRSNSLTALCAAAEAGMGVALLPCWLAAEAPNLRPLPVPEPAPVREAWLLVHRDLREVPRVRAVIDHLVAVFQESRPLLEGGPGVVSLARATPS